MNRAAERHLDRAEKFIAKGTEAWRKAAEEILAARDADPKLTMAKVGERLGHGESWVQRILKWANSDSELPTPFTGDSPGVAARHARQVLRDAPMEQVEQLIGDLPFERQQAVAAAAGDRYAKVRQEADERERRMTPAQHKEREAAAETVRQASADALAGFHGLGIVADLEHATELLAEMIAGGTVTTVVLQKVDAALAAFLDEYRVAQAMAGEEAHA